MKRPSCSKCKRPVSVCYCHTIKHIDNHWPVLILQHPNESKHAIGTANIVELSLTKCKLQVGEAFSEDLFTIDNDQAVLIYPGEGAVSLEALGSPSTQNQAFINQTSQIKQTKTLIFLDASWRKSYRMLMESPVLQALPRVSLHPTQISRYQIRKSKHSHSLSTLEAIAHTLAILEQDEKKYLPLLQSMDWMIEKQIELMGEEVFKNNYGE